MESVVLIIVCTFIAVLCVLLAYLCKVLTAIIDGITHAQISVNITHSEAEKILVHREEPNLSEEGQKAIDEYNEQQRTLMASIVNLQKLFLDEDQLLEGASK